MLIVASYFKIFIIIMNPSKTHHITYLKFWEKQLNITLGVVTLLNYISHKNDWDLFEVIMSN